MKTKNKTASIIVNTTLLSFFLLMMIAILISISLTRYLNAKTDKDIFLKELALQNQAKEIIVLIEPNNTDQVIDNIFVEYDEIADVYVFDISISTNTITVILDHNLELISWEISR